jgi:50S ribosomal protein L16 3-hydroxylase
MNIQAPLPLLGGISPETFMRRYWQKKPLLIRAAIPGFMPLLDRSELLDLAAQDDVESRLVAQAQAGKGTAWKFRHGPFTRKQLPPFKQSAWTLLVQGVDLHDERAHALMQQFRFVPDARLDDLMISFATDGGGVGPHFDSYDVFLLQAQGRRRWRIGRQRDLSLQPGMPLKILANFEPEQEFVLEPGDMLYLPPRYAHDGIAEGDCMTYSIGFRAPAKDELAREILQRVADHTGDEAEPEIYKDPKQPAVQGSAEIPASLVNFARDALQAALKNPAEIQRAVGEYLTEPKSNVWFEAGEALQPGDVRLDRRSRMLFDAGHIYINGESFRASGSDARLIRKLAQQRELHAADMAKLSAGARELASQWCEAGWLYVVH